MAWYGYKPKGSLYKRDEDWMGDVLNYEGSEHYQEPRQNNYYNQQSDFLEGLPLVGDYGQPKDEEMSFNPYAENTPMWDKPKEGEWDSNYGVRQGIETQSEKLDKIGEKPEEPESGDKKAWWVQLLELVGVSGAPINAVTGMGAKQDETEIKRRQLIDQKVGEEIRAMGYDLKFSQKPFGGVQTSLVDTDGKAKTFKFGDAKFDEAGKLLMMAEKEANDEINTMDTLKEEVKGGIDSAKSTAKLGFDVTDNQDYYESGIVDPGIWLDKKEELAKEHGAEDMQQFVDNAEKNFNPLYYIARGLQGGEHTEEKEEVARAWGNIGYDIGSSVALSSLDISDAGKGLKFLNNASDIKKAEKVIGNLDDAQKVAKNSMSFDNFKKAIANDGIYKGMPEGDLKKAYNKFVEDTVTKEVQSNASKGLGAMEDFAGVKVPFGIVGRDTLAKASENVITKNLARTGLSLASPITAITEGVKGTVKGSAKLLDKVSDVGAVNKLNELGEGVKKYVGGGKYHQLYKSMRQHPDKALEYAGQIAQDSQGRMIRDMLKTRALNESNQINKVLKNEKIKPSDATEMYESRYTANKVIEDIDVPNKDFIEGAKKSLTDKQKEFDTKIYKNVVKDIEDGVVDAPKGYKNISETMKEKGVFRDIADNFSKEDIAKMQDGDFTGLESKVKELIQNPSDKLLKQLSSTSKPARQGDKVAKATRTEILDYVKSGKKITDEDVTKISNTIKESFTAHRDNVSKLSSNMKTTKEQMFERFSDFTGRKKGMKMDTVNGIQLTKEQLDSISFSKTLKKYGTNSKVSKKISGNAKLKRDLFQKYQNGDISAIKKSVAKSMKDAPESLINAETQKVISSYGKVMKNISDIVDTDNLNKAISEYYPRVMSDIKGGSIEKQVFKEVKEKYGADTLKSFKTKIRIDETIESFSKETLNNVDIKNKLQKLEFDLNNKKPTNTRQLDTMVNQWKELDPEGFEKVSSQIPKYKKIHKTLSQLEYTDSWSKLPKSIKDMFFQVEKDFIDIAKAEGIVTKAEDEKLFGQYMLHMLADKNINDVTRKHAEKKFGNMIKNSVPITNKHTLKRSVKGSIQDINKSVGQKVFEDNMAVLVAKRKINNANFVYKKDFYNSMFDNFGSRVTVEDFDIDKFNNQKGLTDNQILVAKFPKSKAKPQADLVEHLKDELYGTYKVVVPKELDNKSLDKFLKKEGTQFYTMDQVHFNNMMEFFNDQFKNDMDATLGLFDKASNIFKKGALWSPRYVTNNIVGNVFNSYIGGAVNLYNPKKMFQGYKIYKGKEGKIGKYDYNTIRAYALTQGIKDTQADRIFAGKGINQQVEELKKGYNKNIAKTMWDNTTEFPQKASSNVEQISKFINIATHIENGFSLNEAVNMTNKALFDYADLTQFETTWLKRIIPFYTFMSKNAPLQFEALVNRGGEMNRLGQATEKIQQKTLSDKENAVRPEYMDTMYALGDGKYANFENPMYSAFEMANPMSIIGAMNPIIKTPIEIGANSRTFDQRPISEDDATKTKDYTKHAVQNMLPGTKLFMDLAEGNDKGVYSWGGSPLKDFDVDQASQNAMYSYQDQLKNQYDRALDSNKATKMATEIEKLQKEIENGEKYGYDMSQYRDELKQMILEYSQMN